MLGNALCGLGKNYSDTARLVEAVAALRAALMDEMPPVVRANRHQRLGNAATTLAEREDGSAGLDEAVAALDEALSGTSACDQGGTP